MRRIVRQGLRSILRSDEGATLVEYSLLLALLATVCVAALSTLGCSLTFTFGELGRMIGS